MSEDNLKQKTAKGLLWNTIQNFSVKGVQFLLMLFMARLLTPDDYGTVGLLFIFTQLASTFTECGFTSALIRKQDRTQTDLSTVFYFNVVVSCICYAIIFVIAPFVADFYNKEILCPVLRVMALSLPICSVNGVIVAMMNYSMQFKKQAFISLAQTIVSGIVGLIMALMGYGVWALVGQSLSAAITATLTVWTLNKWHPSLVYSWKSFNEMFGYSSKILITRILDTIYGNIYAIVIGKAFSPATLGHYSRAQNWAAMPSSNLVNILNNVTFASLSKIQDDTERMQRVYEKMIRTSAFIIFPAMMGLSVISHPLITFTIGTKWDLCISILTIICFTYMLSPIHSLNINLLQVKGRSDLSLRLSIIGKIFAIIVLFASMPFGIIPMCYFNILSSVLMLFFNTYYTGKLLNLGFIRQIKDLLPTLSLSCFMYFCVYFSMKIVDINYIQILIGITVGIISYILPAYLLKMQELPDVIEMVKGMKKK